MTLFRFPYSLFPQSLRSAVPMRLVRPLNPARAIMAGCVLSGLLGAGVATALPVQPSPFWHRFIHRFTGHVTDASLSQASDTTPARVIPSDPGSSPISALPSQTRPDITVLPPAPSDFTDEDRQAELTLSTALTFMLPRTLAPHTPQELCLWGMQSLLEAVPPLQARDTAPSASFTFTLQPKTFFTPARLTILYNHQPLLSERTPGRDDVTGWSHLSLRLITLLHRNIPRFQLMSDETLLNHFLNGMLGKLDPYSRYQSPTPPASHSDSVTPDSSPVTAPASVGLTLRRTHARFPVVAALNLNSPLWDAGIAPGDSLVRLDRHSAHQLPLATLQSMLTGQAGSQIELEFHTQDGRQITRTFTRGRMEEESVFPDSTGRYPVLRVTHFSSHTAEEISQYLSTLLPDASPDNGDLPLPSTPASSTAPALPGLILDLRGNHGGILQQAVMTAALFLNHGVIATTEGRAAEANHVWSIQGGDLTNNAPLALLVDQDTGSAAEVLAAALADQQRAVVTGSSSFGKGMVQVSTIMPNGGHLSLTWARLAAPQGWTLQGLGVLPQLCTSPKGQFTLHAQLAALREGHSLMTEALQKSRLIHEDSPDSARHALRQVCPPSSPNQDDMAAILALFASPQAYHTALLHLPDSSSAAHQAAASAP